MFPDMSLVNKLRLLVRVYYPQKPRVKEIQLTEYSKDLFKGSDVFYYKPGDVQTSYKKAIDQSGDTVYYFPNLNENVAYRISRSIYVIRDPAKFILCHIRQEDYLWR